MDPVSAAIIAGATFIATKAGEMAVKDAYNALKDLLNKKLGAKSKVLQAVKDLEANTNSEARKAVVKEEVLAAKAEKDEDLVQAAQKLLKVIQLSPEGQQIVQNAIGDGIIQVAGDHNTVNMSTPRKR